MNVEKKIAEKVLDLEVSPSADLFNKIQKRRTPFHIFTNHIGLYKVRYGLITLLGVSILTGWMLNENQQGELSVQAAEGKNASQMEIKESSKDEYSNVERGNQNVEVSADEIGSAGLGGSRKEAATVPKSSTNRKKNELVVVNMDQRDFINKNQDNQETNSKGDGNSEKVVVANTGLQINTGEQAENGELLDFKHYLTMAPMPQLGDNIELDDIQINKPESKGNSKNRGWVEYVGFGFTPYLANMKMDNGTLGQTIENQTTQQSNLAYGLQIGIPLYKRITLITGVDMMRRNEHFAYKQESGNYVMVIDTTKGVVYIPGEQPRQVERYDTTYKKDGKYKTLNTRVVRNYVELPLVFSYNLKEGDKFGLSINPGLRLGFLSTSGGSMVQSDGSVAELNNDSKVYSRNILLSAELGLQFDYVLNRKLKLFATPVYRAGLSNMLEGSYDATQRYNQLGLQAGIRMNIR